MANLRDFDNKRSLKIDVKWLYLGPKIENLKSEQGDLLVDPQASFCVIFMRIGSLSFSE